MTITAFLVSRMKAEHCTQCGAELPPRPSRSSDWGDWKCDRCGSMFCQDCGAELNHRTMQCTAYEAFQDDQEALF